MDYHTNEGKFFEDLRRFADEVSRAGPVDASELEKLVRFYENPMRKADPLLELRPSAAKALQAAQRKAAPDLKHHPFFKRVDEIACERWSREMQKLIDAQSYLVQVEMCAGISPELVPPQEVIQIILDARASAPDYRVKAVDPGWKVPQASTSRASARASAPSSDLPGIPKKFLKENW